MYRFLIFISLGVVALLIGTLSIEARDERADLVIANSDECRTLDPHLATWTHETRLCQSLYEGLTRLDPNTLQPLPGAAESWTVSDDGRVYTFTLRPDARWSNGDPLTASDFLYAWERSMNPRIASDYSHLAFMVRGAQAYYESIAAHDQDNAKPILPFSTVGVQVINDRTLRVELEAPCAYFLDVLDFVPFWPVHRATYESVGAYHWPPSFDAVDGKYDAGHDVPAKRHLATRPEHFVSNGAFTLDKWQFKRRIRLKKNPYYWRAGDVRIDTVDVLPVSDANTRFLGFETGAWDITTDPPTQVMRRLAAMDASGERNDFHNQPLLATYFYRFNCRRFPFDDAAVRRALSMAVDRNIICDKVLGGGQAPASSFVPAAAADVLAEQAASGDWVRYQPPAGLPFDPQAARQTLIDAGWRYADDDGPPTRDGKPFPTITITYNSDTRHALVAQAIARMWRDHLGLNIELRNLELKVFYERERKGDYDISRGSWFADYLDASGMMSVFTSHSGHNRTGWSNSEYDGLVAAADVELDPARRLALLAGAERILVETDPPILPLFHYTGSMLISDRVGGISPNIRNIPFLQAAFIRDEGGVQ